MKTRTVKVSAKTRKLYERRDQSLDHGDVPQLSPDEWAKATVGKFYRPIKTSIRLRIDNDNSRRTRMQAEFTHAGKLHRFEVSEDDVPATVEITSRACPKSPSMRFHLAYDHLDADRNVAIYEVMTFEGA
jgi:hypothetical protein